MIQNEDFSGEKVTLYRADLPRSLPLKAVAVALALLVASLWTGSLDRSLLRQIERTQQYTRGYSAQFPVPYDVQRATQGRYDRFATHVTRANAAQHRFYRSATWLSWWAFVMSLVAAGVMTWRRGIQEEAEALFGKDTAGYRDFMASLTPDPEARTSADLRNDWLLSGLPSEQPEPVRVRPVFGRKDA